MVPQDHWEERAAHGKVFHPHIIVAAAAGQSGAADGAYVVDTVCRSLPTDVPGEVVRSLVVVVGRQQAATARVEDGRERIRPLSP